MRWVWLIIVMGVSGCATQGADTNPERASYFLVSQGKVSIIHRLLTGGVDYCKVTQYNLGASDYSATVTYDGKRCTVTGAVNAPEATPEL